MLAFYLALLDTEEQKDKLEQIYTHYRGLMFHVASSVLHDQYLAEDAVHETFLDLIRIIDEVRVNNRQELTRFLKILTYHKAIDLVRKYDKHKKADDELETGIPNHSADTVETVVFGKLGYSEETSLPYSDATVTEVAFDEAAGKASVCVEVHDSQYEDSSDQVTHLIYHFVCTESATGENIYLLQSIGTK